MVFLSPSKSPGLERPRIQRPRIQRPRIQRPRPHPAQVVVLGYVTAIAVGTGLLMLPMSRVGPGGADFVNALFTATSAVCVTGLATVDTALYWTDFGRVVILLLIQIGGLGIMLFASLIGLSVARKLSVRSRLTTAAESQAVGFNDARGLALGILRITVTVEALTFAALTLRWLALGHPLGEAAWWGVFHAVAAFNNAGFSVFSNNLIDYATDPWICLPICAAVILGGIGFPVIMQLRREFRSAAHWTMNTKLVLIGTFSLLAIGTVLTCIFEWTNSNTLGQFSFWDKILVGFFHSVQTRTAGFNSVDVGQLTPETWLISDLLMFIGAGPAGTGGGIKITTFAVLFFIMLAELRGAGAVNIFGKRLSRAVHRQAITIVLLAMAAILGATIAIMMITRLDLDVVQFEVISAFATVGLSTGITPLLPPSAKLILVALMILGRLGPLTLGTAIALRRRRILYELPKERPVIG